jgi:signal transduction histidine kinase
MAVVVELLFAVPAVAALTGQAVPRARPFAATGAWAGTAGTVLALALWHGQGAPDVVGFWPLLGTAALAGNVVVVCRRASPRAAVAASSATVVAGSLLALPITGPAVANWRAGVAVCLFWSLAGLAGVGFGLYLRQLDAARVRAVRAARREQRVRLATDLHDFVAHDVSAMVVQVQAARILLPAGHDDVAEVLARVEADGVRSLSALDRTLRLLRDMADGDPDGPGAAALPELVDRFARAWDGPVRLDAEPGLASELSTPAGSAVYRVVLEALTNVRRHAPRGAVVDVRLRRDQGGVVLSVTNEHGVVRPPTPRPGRHGGTGLAGLAERVEVLGGSLAFGRTGAAGWRVRAELPAATRSERS